MATIKREELNRLERRGLQLTILSAIFVLILATGLALLMYPLVFVHPEGNKWTLRVAFLGFCALTLLFLVYLFDRQRTFTQLKQHLLAEIERNLALQIQASNDLLNSMPDLNHFWDRLTMEFRRARSMEKNLSLLLVTVKLGAKSNGKDQNAPLSDTAKAMARGLRPSDSIYRLSNNLFGVVLPETDMLNSERIAVRFQKELEGVRAYYGCRFELSTHNYPAHVKSEHELEDIVKSLLPENETGRARDEAPVAGGDLRTAF